MGRIRTGLIAGMVFGLIDILIMIPIDMPDKNIAMLGAFTGRFAIGFLIPNTSLPLSSWLKGLIIGFLISLPDAIITKVFGPVLGVGLIGGAVIGYLTKEKEK